MNFIPEKYLLAVKSCLILLVFVLGIFFGYKISNYQDEKEITRLKEFETAYNSLAISVTKQNQSVENLKVAEVKKKAEVKEAQKIAREASKELYSKSDTLAGLQLKNLIEACTEASKLIESELRKEK